MLIGVARVEHDSLSRGSWLVGVGYLVVGTIWIGVGIALPRKRG